MIDKTLFEDIDSLTAEYSKVRDISSLRLKYPEKQFAIDQIEARRRHSDKLPDFLSYSHFLFPTLLSGEQATNQWIARFNASFASATDIVADLTCGLGIDALSLAQRCQHLTAFDLDEIKVITLSNNADILGISNIKAICADSIQWLKTHDNHFDIIYVDPARRSATGGRVSFLEDCQPDIVKEWNLLLSRADKMIVKASPMLDISDTLSRLSEVASIYIVCFKGECKEVMVLAGKWSQSVIAAVDMDKEGELSRFEIPLSDFNKKKSVKYLEKDADLNDGFLYLPNAALMKMNCWGEVQEHYPSLLKLDSNTHIFYSKEKIRNFPGRGFKVLEIIDKKSLKRLGKTDLNVISRNHPMKAEEIEKRYRLTPRGSRYLIVCKVLGKTCMFYTELF